MKRIFRIAIAALMAFSLILTQYLCVSGTVITKGDLSVEEWIAAAESLNMDDYVSGSEEFLRALKNLKNAKYNYDNADNPELSAILGSNEIFITGSVGNEVYDLNYVPQQPIVKTYETPASAISVAAVQKRGTATDGLRLSVLWRFSCRQFPCLSGTDDVARRAFDAQRYADAWQL